MRNNQGKGIAVTIITPIGAFGASHRDTRLDSFLRQFAIQHNTSNESEGDVRKYGTDIETDTAIMHEFCWCDKEESCPYCFNTEDNNVPEELKSKYGMEVDKPAPNFWYKPLDFKVWWYKYIARSVETNKVLTDDEFSSMVQHCLRTS